MGVSIYSNVKVIKYGELSEFTRAINWITRFKSDQDTEAKRIKNIIRTKGIKGLTKEDREELINKYTNSYSYRKYLKRIGK